MTSFNCVNRLTDLLRFVIIPKNNSIISNGERTDAQTLGRRRVSASFRCRALREFGAKRRVPKPQSRQVRPGEDRVFGEWADFLVVDMGQKTAHIH